MLEMVLFGVILTVSMVVASLITTLIAWKIMMSKKFWKKCFEISLNMMTELNSLEENSYKEEEA